MFDLIFHELQVELHEKCLLYGCYYRLKKKINMFKLLNQPLMCFISFLCHYYKFVKLYLSMDSHTFHGLTCCVHRIRTAAQSYFKYLLPIGLKSYWHLFFFFFSFFFLEGHLFSSFHFSYSPCAAISMWSIKGNRYAKI